MSRDTLEHIAFRVRAAAFVGGLGGTFTGLYRGHHSIFRTAGLTSLSCAMAATACFTSERLVNNYVMNKDPSPAGLLVSHAAGGAIGGSLLGFLYQGRPLRGAFFFAPLMMLIAVAENSWLTMKDENPIKQQDLTTNEKNRE